MAKQELTQTFKTEGAEAAAQKINALEKAQADLLRAEEDLRRATANPYRLAGDLDGLQQAVERARSKLSDLKNQVDETKFSADSFATLLGQVHPALGAVAQGANNAAKSIGQIATKQIDANAIFAAAKKGIGEYAGTIKLLAAGGAVLGALALIKKAWEGIKQEEQDAIDTLRNFQQSQSTVEAKKEAVRAGVIDTFAQTRPDATADDIQNAVGLAFREVINLGTDVAGSVARATGQAAPLSREEAEFRKRNQGFGSRRDKAREQLKSFGTIEGTFGGTGNGTAIDTGNRQALLDIVEQLFGETGEAAQVRIAAAQKLIAQRQGRLSIGIPEGSEQAKVRRELGLDEDKRQGGELLRALQLAGEHLERGAKAQADLADRAARKVPTNTVQPRIEPGIG